MPEPMTYICIGYWRGGGDFARIRYKPFQINGGKSDDSPRYERSWTDFYTHISAPRTKTLSQYSITAVLVTSQETFNFTILRAHVRFSTICSNGFITT